jgi:PAS domain S-box-containing protein
MKISTKVAVIFLSVGTGATLLGLSITTKISQRDLEKVVGEQQLTTARGIMGTLDRFLAERYMDVHAIATRDTLRRLLNEGNNESGVQKELDQLVFLTGPWDALAVIDTEGNIQGISQRSASGTELDPAMIAETQKVLAHHIHVSDLIDRGEKRRPTMIFASEVYRDLEGTGEPIGAVVGLLSWPAVIDIVEAAGIGYEVELLDQTGRTIATNVMRHVEPPSTIQGLLSLASKEGPQVGLVDHEGEEALAAVAPQLGHREYRGNNWRLLVFRPVSEAFALVRSSIAQTVFVSLIVFSLVAILIILVMNGLVVRPVQILKEAVERVGAGDLSIPVKADSQDELGGLARTFEKMRRSLLDSRKELESKAKQLSRQVGELTGTRTAMMNLLGNLSEAKADVEESMARTEALLASVGEGVLVVDMTGKILNLNKAGEEMLGVGSRDLLGKDWYQAIPFVDREGRTPPKDSRPIAWVLKNLPKYPISEEVYFYRRADGKTVPFGATVSLATFDGKPIGVVQVFRDLTKEHEIDRAKLEFVSLASHQLRMPLTTISWYVEMLRDEGKNLKPEQKEQLEQVFHSNRRMIELVNALLDVSRIELGTFLVQAKPSDLKSVVSTVLSDLSATLKSRKQKVELSLGRNTKFNFDPRLMYIMLQNLISNSSKYSPVKSSISVKLQNTSKQIRIEVTDEGCGIADADMPKLFQKLFRSDKARTLDPDGTGLGLYIVKSIVDQAKGTLEVDSQVGKGTTMRICFSPPGMISKQGDKALV